MASLLGNTPEKNKIGQGQLVFSTKECNDIEISIYTAHFAVTMKSENQKRLLLNFFNINQPHTGQAFISLACFYFPLPDPPPRLRRGRGAYFLMFAYILKLLSIKCFNSFNTLSILYSTFSLSIRKNLMPLFCIILCLSASSLS